MPQVPDTYPLDRAGREVVTGWGRTAPARTTVVAPTTIDEVADVVRRAPARGVLARGLGRSYGDAAQTSGGVAVDLGAFDTVSFTDGRAAVGAGVSLDRLMRETIPGGWFVPVTPGTRKVTIGGAIAADIHGKNQHVDGSIGVHVSSMTLVDGSGAIRSLTAGDEAFWATVGGMGLTGIITDATIDLIPITSSRMLVDTERADGIDDLMARMVEGDGRYRYTVAWLDTLSERGRGVITSGDHASIDDLPPGQRSGALAFDPRSRVRFPRLFPSGALNALSIRAFNEAWFRKAPRHRMGELQSIAEFFHPLDGVIDWNHAYGRRGFVQYQFVVADGDVVVAALRRLRAARAPSFLSVLKRFGPGNPAPLSFPQPGWTLAVDIPAGVDGLDRVLDDLDVLVAESGGRVYLAKDSRMSPDMMRVMYPRLAEWQESRARLDPRGVFASDLGRRLHL